MTVCVAVLCENGKGIVLATDQKIGMGFVEGELPIAKTYSLLGAWCVMVSGDDIAPAFDIIEEAREQLVGLQRRQKLEVPIFTAREVMDTVCAAFRRKRLVEAEAINLAPRGWTVARFLSEGRSLLGDALFTKLDSELERAELRISLMVAGFDAEQTGHIFSVHDPGIARQRDVPGFHAIGSGYFGAIDAMLYRKVNLRMSVSQALCFALEAKMAGERAPGVGENTLLYMIRPTEHTMAVDTVFGPSLEVVRKICDTLKPRPLEPQDKAKIAALPEVVAHEAALNPKLKQIPQAPTVTPPKAAS